MNRGLFARVGFVLVILLGYAPPVQADTYIAPSTATPGTVGVRLLDGFLGTSVISRAMWSRVDDESVMPVTYRCDADSRVTCTPPTDAKWGIGANIVLRPCTEAQSAPCIESVVTGSSSLKAATYVRRVKGPEWAENPSLKLPAGGTISLWTASESLSPSGSRDFAVVAKLSMDYGFSGREPTYYGIATTVVPFTTKTGTQYQEIKWSDASSEARIQGQGYSRECVWIEQGLCGAPEDLVDDVRIQVTLRLPSRASGWFMGRLKDAEMSVKALTKSEVSLTVSALPIRSPRFYAEIPTGRITKALEENLSLNPNSGGTVATGLTASDQTLRVFQELNQYSQDRAAGSNSTWFFNSFPMYLGNNPCFKKENTIFGLVATNAMVYSGRPPIFDKGQLQYTVASTHLDAQGKVIKGEYDLLINSQTARCLYGFSRAPLSASFSITQDGKISNVATTTLSENSGWIRLSAKNFTFSTRTINVKLSQKATITCVKGSIRKKVSGSPPVCPRGTKQVK